MSYSFSIKASTKAEVVSRVEAELSQVVASQPSHAADRQAAQDAIKAFIAVVKDPDEGGFVQVSVSVFSEPFHSGDGLTPVIMACAKLTIRSAFTSACD